MSTLLSFIKANNISQPPSSPTPPLYNIESDGFVSTSQETSGPVCLLCFHSSKPITFHRPPHLLPPHCIPSNLTDSLSWRGNMVKMDPSYWSRQCLIPHRCPQVPPNPKIPRRYACLLSFPPDTQIRLQVELAQLKAELEYYRKAELEMVRCEICYDLNYEPCA